MVHYIVIKACLCIYLIVVSLFVIDEVDRREIL